MDPITSFSLASGAAQLTDFMFKLITGTWAIYKSVAGASEEYASLEFIASRLQTLSDNIAHASVLVKAGLIDTGIGTIAQECSRQSKQLLQALDELKRDDKTVWKSFWAALKTVWTKNQIDSMVACVGRMQSQLLLHLQSAILSKQSSIHEAIRQIDERTLQLRIDHAETLQQIRDTIKTELNKGLKAELTLAVNEFQAVTEAYAAQITNDQTTSDRTTSDQPILPETDSAVLQLLNHWTNLTSTAQKRNKEHAFLSTLYFDTIMSRQAGIPMAHPQTFDWIYRNKMPDGTPVHFNSWLRNGQGIFWIRGKAGSGKSTLTKYVIQSALTRKILQAWAGTNELVVANHFFWNSGSKLQMSQMGLFRTLLFDILRRCPEVIPQVVQAMPHVTEEAYRWTTEDLLSVMECVWDQHISKKFCFFIDGLDEYEGDHYQLIEMLQRLASFKKAKVCCSSRPWSCFIDAFGEDPDRLLKLEDLTKDDIRRYVQDNFNKHTQFHKHQHDPAYANLVDDVVGRAHGVFLWVFLVVRSLRDGLTYADRVSDLQKRLDSLPPDLETFFQHILDSVEPFYKQQSAELFLLAAYAPESLPLPIYTILDNIDEHPSKVLGMTVTARELGPVPAWKDKMARRFDARTKGLLELKKHTVNDLAVLSHSNCYVEVKKHTANDLTVPSHNHRYVQVRAEFLHRTVRDFLLTGDVDAMLKRRSRPDFSPAMRLCQAFLVFLRSGELMRAPAISSFVESFVYFAWRIEQEQGTPAMALMKTAEAALAKLDWVPQPRSGRLSREPQPRTLFALALQRGLNLYTLRALQQEPGGERVRAETAANPESPLLSLVLLPTESAPYHRWNISVALVQQLLAQGASPSARPKKDDPTPFQLFVAELEKRPLRGSWKGELGLEYSETKAVLGTMISYGAPLNRDSTTSVRDTIRARFDKMDADYLLSLSPQSPWKPLTKAKEAGLQATHKALAVSRAKTAGTTRPASPAAAKTESPKGGDNNSSRLTSKLRGLLSKKENTKTSS